MTSNPMTSNPALVSQLNAALTANFYRAFHIEAAEFVENRADHLKLYRVKWYRSNFADKTACLVMLNGAKAWPLAPSNCKTIEAEIAARPKS